MSIDPDMFQRVSHPHILLRYVVVFRLVFTIEKCSELYYTHWSMFAKLEISKPKNDFAAATVLFPIMPQMCNYSIILLTICQCHPVTITPVGVDSQWKKILRSGKEIQLNLSWADLLRTRHLPTYIPSQPLSLSCHFLCVSADISHAYVQQYARTDLLLFNF